MELELTIKRIGEGKYGTFGVILFDDVPFALTLERPWLDNQKGISCIPSGLYKCKRVDSPKFGDTFEVEHVPMRTHILFHKGNLDDDSHGCILIGEQYEYLKGDPAILASKKGFNEFKAKLSDVDEFTLYIMWCL
jgi:hypothetical protein